MYQFKDHDFLSAEEEKELAVRAKNGDAAAREKLIVSNLRFVSSCVKPFRNCGLSYDDLMSEGVFGLIEGIDHFDPEKGVRLITYARFWIRQAVMKALDANTATAKGGFNFSQMDDPNYYLDVADTQTENLEDVCVNNDTAARIQRAVLSLKPNEIEILANHYGLFGAKPKTFKEIAEMRGRTKARIHQIEKNAVSKLRDQLSAMGA